LANKFCNITFTVVTDYYVLLVIFVEVSGNDCGWRLLDGNEGWRLEAALAIAQQDCQCICIGTSIIAHVHTRIGDHEIEFAIVIEISGSDSHWPHSYGNIESSAKLSIAVSEEDRDSVRFEISDSQIHIVITVQIESDHPRWNQARRKNCRRTQMSL